MYVTIVVILSSFGIVVVVLPFYVLFANFIPYIYLYIYIRMLTSRWLLNCTLLLFVFIIKCCIILLNLCLNSFFVYFIIILHCVECYLVFFSFFLRNIYIGHQGCWKILLLGLFYGNDFIGLTKKKLKKNYL